MTLGKRTAALKKKLDAMPGATATPMTAATGKVPLVILYKVLGKTFAILSVREDEFVLVKCAPGIVDILKETYQGVSHRSHLDRRFWIAVALDADIPAKEVRGLVERSYDVVGASLTKKQQAELAALSE